MMPARGPPSVLWVVVVTTSAPARPGSGAGPAATSPAKCAMSTISIAPTSSAISRKRGEVELARVGGPAGDDQLRSALARHARDRVHVDQARLGVDLVGRDVVEAAREVDLHAVREVAAVGEREAHDRVPGLQQRVVDRRVRLRARVRLDVGVLGAEELLRAVDRQLLGHVDPLAAAVVAPAGVALGVLVGQHRALAFEHRRRNEVLGGDHLERRLLALELPAQRPRRPRGRPRQAAGRRVVSELGHGALLRGCGFMPRRTADNAAAAPRWLPPPVAPVTARRQAISAPAATFTVARR